VEVSEPDDVDCVVNEVDVRQANCNVAPWPEDEAVEEVEHVGWVVRLFRSEGPYWVAASVVHGTGLFAEVVIVVETEIAPAPISAFD